MSVLACVIAVGLFGASPAAADGGRGGDSHSNIVQAANSNAAAPVVRTGTALAQDGAGSAVTDTNLAFARSFNCTGCRTVAVAVQVVVVEGSPSNFQPQNGAVAVNDSCNTCQTFAYAHQYIIQTTHEVNFEEGLGERLWGIRSKIAQVANSGADFVTMNSQLDQLSLDFYNTVSQAVQSHNSGDGGQESERRQVQQKD